VSWDLRDARADEVWNILSRWRGEGRRFALATVIESRGFTPRKPGSHMLVAEDGATVGTIGGGAIEGLVVEQARALLESGGTSLVRKHLTQELGMCCGGEMAVFVEILEPAPRLLLFGAGYVARAIAAQARSCDFDVTVVDERAEWVVAERFPGARLMCASPEDVARTFTTCPTDYAVVVTHDHALDQRVVQVLLERPLKFLGLVGSVPKQRKFALRLRARGFTDAEIARVRCPLGMPIGAQTPEEIAVSVVGELIAVRRGASTSSWASVWVPPARAGRTETEDESETKAEFGAEIEVESRTGTRARSAPPGKESS
jgi:xanthine dehydrogenase accessory factor